MSKSAPHIPEDDIEATAQQPVQEENPPADGDKQSHSDESPELTYEQRLYRYTIQSKRSEYFLDIDNLSRLNIVHLMNELVKYEQAMRKDKAAPQDIGHLEDLLHRYTTAVQDRGYWSRLSKVGGFLGKYYLADVLRDAFPEIYPDYKDDELAYLDNSFKSKSGPIDPLRSFLKKVLPTALTWSQGEIDHRDFHDYLNGKPPQEITTFVDTLARFIVAITGGLSLVVPMLVMRLGESLPKSLTTVSVAVVLFAALTSLMFKASNVETLGATAAYAAVLVVFVGTSG